MTPRYVVLTKAFDNCELGELPKAELVSAEGIGTNVEFLPGLDPETLRSHLIELLESDLVRIYLKDGEIDPDGVRVVSSSEAIVVASGEWSSTARPVYFLITTPAGDDEWKREWQALGEPPVLIAERTVVAWNAANADRTP
jgi:hypothetical protein